MGVDDGSSLCAHLRARRGDEAPRDALAPCSNARAASDARLGCGRIWWRNRDRRAGERDILDARGKRK